MSSAIDEMRVLKRTGQHEEVSFDKILTRLKRLGQEAGLKLNYANIAMKVIDQLYDGISASKIDDLCAQQCASLASTHPDFNTLAGRIVVSNHHKNTSASFSDTMIQLYTFKDKHGKHSPLISDELYVCVNARKSYLDAICVYARDYLIEYFGFKTLEKSYLSRIDGKPVERPQHMWLRVALGIHLGSDESSVMHKVKETYDLMSLKYFTHATPTLFNAGTPHPQLSSCYLIAMESDSIDGIYNTLKDCALISKWAGGIGMHIHNVRASGSHIRGTNGSSNGIVPMLRVFNNTAKYVDQCVSPETKIHTDCGFVAIRDIEPGVHRVSNVYVCESADFGKTQFLQMNDTRDVDDLVNAMVEKANTHDGFDDVVKLVEHDYDGEIICIRTSASDPDCTLRITHHHPIPIIAKEDRDRYISGTEQDRAQIMQWKEATDVVPGDYFMQHNSSAYRITHVWNEHYTGKLYDLEMKTYPNYATEHGVLHNGGGRRNGSIAVYLEPWHADIELFLQMRKNHGDEELKARDLFYALWVPDLFMERVKTAGQWTLMCPDECPGLADVYGADFVSLYEKYEAEGKCRKTMKARDLWFQILDAQMETGTPYLLFKDAANAKSNQKNVGIIKSSNLCVSGDTFILTDKGGVQIKSVCGEDVNVWNGEEWSRVTIHKTGENQSLISVQLRRSRTDTRIHQIDCTPYHKFYVRTEMEGEVREMRATDLSIGMNLIPLTAPTDLCDYSHISYDNMYVCGIHDYGNKGDTYCFTEPKRNMGVFNGILTGQCTEIMEVSTPDETAVCNLASIALPTFVILNEDGESKALDYDKLHEVAKVVAYNLNRVIDVNFYPTPKTETSNARNRPIGIGVQGLADVFIMLGYPFASDEAKQINRDIFETIYHAALEQSMDLAITEGPYETFAGSPASQGILQFDMWNIEPGNSRYDWAKLKQQIQQNGLRNSLLIAPMPTASTSQILGYNECVEPITSNIYSRRTLAGEFIMANRYLMSDLLELGLWTDQIKNSIIANNGSIQHIEVIPAEIREKYRTVWEIPMKHLIDMSADRGAFICQSQSLNLWVEDPTYNTLTSMHFYSWKKGLKTGMYYLRRRGKHQAQQFTIEPEKREAAEDDEVCEMCSA